MKKEKIFLLILFVALQKIYGTDVQITDKELGFYFTPEYNRAFYFCWDTSAVAAIKLNNRYAIKSGLAMGTAGSAFEIKWFVGGETPLTTHIPLYLGLSYNYNGLPKYENHAHSTLLLASLKWQRAGISLGPTFRLTSFFGEPPVFEPVLSMSVYMNIIDNDFARFGIKIANFNDFTYGNFGAYFLNLNNVIRLNDKISIINEIELHQSGSVALTSNFYGLVYRGGVTFSW